MINAFIGCYSSVDISEQEKSTSCVCSIVHSSFQLLFRESPSRLSIFRPYFDPNLVKPPWGGGDFNRRVTGMCHLTSEIVP